MLYNYDFQNKAKELKRVKDYILDMKNAPKQVKKATKFAIMGRAVCPEGVLKDILSWGSIPHEEFSTQSNVIEPCVLTIRQVVFKWKDGLDTIQMSRGKYAFNRNDVHGSFGNALEDVHCNKDKYYRARKAKDEAKEDKEKRKKKKNNKRKKPDRNNNNNNRNESASVCCVKCQDNFFRLLYVVLQIVCIYQT